MIKKMMLVILPALMAICSLFCANTDRQVSASFSETEELNDSIVNPASAIAYVRNSSEIRLINRDGTNDRKIWSHPDAKYPVGIFELAWRPDGRELAFSSAHNSIFSFYHSDIYTVRPDGSGFRKITTGPDHKDFGKFKKGIVSVTVKNMQYSFQQAQSSVGVFIVNVVGAKEPQHITLPPGASKTLMFKDVADFGDHAQAVVAMSGSYRWIMPGTDVQAGKNVKAPDMLISGDGIELFGAFRPTWKSDGSEISFRSGVCVISKVAVKSSGPSFVSEPMFTGENPSGSCVWDWGPTPALANQIIYSENSSEERASIFLTKVGGSHPGKHLTFFSELQLQIPSDLRWLPDGSGFLYATIHLEYDRSNIFHYDIGTGKTKQITQLATEFARGFCISPDGKWIVYERSPTWDENESPVDLWMINIDGKQERLLVKNGQSPSWSK